MNIALIGLGMVAGTHVTAIKSSEQGLILRGVLAVTLPRPPALQLSMRPMPTGP